MRLQILGYCRPGDYNVVSDEDGDVEAAVLGRRAAGNPAETV